MDYKITVSLAEVEVETLGDITRPIYEGISMTKFNNLKVKRVESNLKYTESKLVKKKKPR